MAATKKHKKQMAYQPVKRDPIGLPKRIIALVLCILLVLGMVILPVFSALG